MGATDLLSQLLMLRRRWRIIGAIAGLCLGIALLALSQMKLTYTATGILIYDPHTGTVPGDPAVPAIDSHNEDMLAASQSAIITSLPAVNELARRLDLAALPEFNPMLRHGIWPFSALLPPSLAETGLAAATQAALHVDVLPSSRVITVSFTSRDPALAANAANLAMQLYLQHQRGQSLAAIEDAQSWMANNTNALQTALDDTEAQLAHARAAAGIVSGSQASLTTETASELTASLVQAQAKLAMDQARLNSAAKGDAAAANAAIAPNLLPMRKAQADLVAQVQSLSRQYGANYPDLVVARASLAAMSSEIGAETGRELDAAKADVAADQAGLGALQAALTAARVESQAEDTEAAPIRVLEQRAEADQTMLKNMALQADRLAQAASLAQPDAKILSAAVQPGAPNARHRGVILLAAVLFGLCMGMLIAVLMDVLDTSLRSGEALTSLCGVSCLGLLPEASAAQMAPLLAPFSVFSEQLRAIQTGLSLGVEQRHCVVAITAARPGEGKTTLTIALARLLAQSGLRVVAIDGDVRRPNFDKVFHLQKCGLTDYLAGKAAFDEILQQDPHTSLAVITAGEIVGDVLPLFLAPQMSDVVDVLRTDFDVVLFDVPPALALAEGRVLARFADEVLLCVRWGSTPRRVANAARILLQESDVDVTGAVLTRVNVAAHRRSGFADAEIYQRRYNSYFQKFTG